MPFDARAEYDQYVDGKPRVDGVRDFLASRDIVLPEGTNDDPATALTVNGLGNRKNEAVRHRIRTQGVRVFEDPAATWKLPSKRDCAALWCRPAPTPARFWT